MKNLLDINEYHKTLLGLSDPWVVKKVDLSIEEQTVNIYVEYPLHTKVSCPVCQLQCSVNDYAPERRWRHLDTMQFKTTVISKTPRSDCNKHGVKNINVVLNCIISRCLHLLSGA